MKAFLKREIPKGTPHASREFPHASGDYNTDRGLLTFHSRQWKSHIDNITHHAGFYHPTEGYMSINYYFEEIDLHTEQSDAVEFFNWFKNNFYIHHVNGLIYNIMKPNQPNKEQSIQEFYDIFKSK